MRGLTTQEFISKAVKIWGDRFDYSETIYVKSGEKVAIGCKNPEHGIFWMTPDNHTHKTNPQGCKKCSGRGLLPPTSERIVGEQYIVDGKVRTWDGRRLLCEHNNRISYCEECGGSQWCDHGNRKDRCRECEGSQWCDHGNIKSFCRECFDLGIGGGGLCQHRRARSTCKECWELGIGGGGLCDDHGEIRSHCRECGGGSYCQHDRPRSKCRECGGGSYCQHDRIRSTCKECWELGIGGGSLCDHGIRRVECPDCEGSQRCQHGMRRNRCLDCDGSQRCDHRKLKFQCEICDPDGYLANRIRATLRQAIRRQGGIKDSLTIELLGCSIEEFRAYFESMFSDEMNWENVDRWHIDHIRPCASFDLKDPEEQRMCFHFTNLQPLWAEENLSKHDKYDPENFEREWNGERWELIE